jgi:hypothetical protein
VTFELAEAGATAKAVPASIKAATAAPIPLVRIRFKVVLPLLSRSSR